MKKIDSGNLYLNLRKAKLKSKSPADEFIGAEKID